ncbi:MAG: hypothetical protein OHK0044_25470 [Burkholderiaceae bacterium]
MRSTTSVRTVAASLGVVLVGGMALALATDGFAAFTYDGARALRALRAPTALAADLEAITDEGRRLRLGDLSAPVLVVNFVYTQCNSVCRSSGDLFGRLQESLVAEIDAGRVRLLTVSIDPQRDSPQALARYRARYARGPARGWTLAAPSDGAQLARWLDAFGVVVIPTPDGEFEHNAAIAVVGPQRRIVAFVAPEKADELPRRIALVLDEADA